MPWQEWTIVQQRLEFVMLVQQTDNSGELCRRLGISRSIGYKRRARYAQLGGQGLQDR